MKLCHMNLGNAPTHEHGIITAASNFNHLNSVETTLTRHSACNLMITKAESAKDSLVPVVLIAIADI